jgi:hypothetical protein
VSGVQLSDGYCAPEDWDTLAFEKNETEDVTSARSVQVQHVVMEIVLVMRLKEIVELLLRHHQVGE